MSAVLIRLRLGHFYRNGDYFEGDIVRCDQHLELADLILKR